MKVTRSFILHAMMVGKTYKSYFSTSIFENLKIQPPLPNDNSSFALGTNILKQFWASKHCNTLGVIDTLNMLFTLDSLFINTTNSLSHKVECGMAVHGVIRAHFLIIQMRILNKSTLACTVEHSTPLFPHVSYMPFAFQFF